MSIDLRLLRFAKALVDYGSFSKAAEALNMAQPSLSRGIQELEARVGAPLFVRSRLGNELTEVGRLFMQHAERILLHSRNLDLEVALIKGLGSPEVSVAMGPYVVDGLGARCALGFADRVSSARIRVVQVDSVNAIRQLRERKADLLVMEESVASAEEGIELVASLVPLKAQIMVRRGHPLLQMNAPNLTDVLDYPFAQVSIVPPRLLQHILSHRRRRSTPDPFPFPAFKCATLRMALGIVAESDAFAIGNIALMKDERTSGNLAAINLDAPWFHSKWAIFRLREVPETPHIAAAVEALVAANDRLLLEWERFAEETLP